MRDVHAHSGGNSPRSRTESGQSGSALMTTMQINRRDFLNRTCAAGGAMVLGFWLPPTRVKAAAVAAQPWYRGSKDPEINAWLTIAPDDTVTIADGERESGKGVLTMSPMGIAEARECDWSKVRVEYAPAKRNAREQA